ncbi:hypothetical protein AB0M87_17515 [Streptomyces sp. NPDC051320]|uniref:hypothetical protein n=1 Tax=Streptomyces sp. NPDC051320 TaxID=3154644 RepID=UPI0034312124
MAWGVLPGQAWATDSPGSYVFDAHARTVAGAAVSTDAEQLKAGSVYRSTIKPGGQLYYQVDLDATSNAYVSAVAVPPLGSQASVGYSDGIKVTFEDPEGGPCGYDQAAVFGSAEYPRPIAAYASRTVGGSRVLCRTAGPYYVLIERETKATSTHENWNLEIRFDTEPGLKPGADSPTQAPTSWPSASAVPPSGTSERTHGGTGFNDAHELTAGVWQDRIEPGRTLFYRVPVGWGQQVFATADLGSSTGDGYVGSALTMRLYNPVRGGVTAGSTAFDGKPKSAALDPMAPVAYVNRYSVIEEVNGARTAGDYYLAVSLSPDVGKEFGRKKYGVTLRMTVRGDKTPAPAYAGAAPGFGGADAGQGTDNATMTWVGVAGIGAGTVLILGLGMWTVLARRPAATDRPQAPAPVGQRYGPPPAR